MQLFGLGIFPDSVDEMYDTHVIKLPTEACELLYGKAHSENAAWLSKKVDGPDGETFDAWKTLSKGHAKHPCFYWVCADDRHAWWALQHGIAMCEAYTKRFDGKIHKTEYHLRHILAHTPAPPTENVGCIVSEFKQKLLEWMQDDPLKQEKTDLLLSKTCTVNPPSGCVFGILACDVQEFAIRDQDGDIDWVSSYRKYYVSKAQTFKRPSVSMKRCRDTYEFVA